MSRIKGEWALMDDVYVWSRLTGQRAPWWLYISPAAIDFFDLPAFVQDRATDKRLVG